MTDLLGTITGDRVSFTRHHDTGPADLWDAVTSPERLARWFAPVEGDLQEGGAFVIHFDDADTPACRVLACDAPRSFVWEWTHGSSASTVSVEVSADGDGFRLVVEHSRLDPDRVPGYAAGWDAYLQSLDAHLTGRDVGDWWERWADLRDAYADSVRGVTSVAFICSSLRRRPLVVRATPSSSGVHL